MLCVCATHLIPLQKAKGEHRGSTLPSATSRALCHGAAHRSIQRSKALRHQAQRLSSCEEHDQLFFNDEALLSFLHQRSASPRTHGVGGRETPCLKHDRHHPASYLPSWSLHGVCGKARTSLRLPHVAAGRFFLSSFSTKPSVCKKARKL